MLSHVPDSLRSQGLYSPWNGLPFLSAGALPNPGIEPRSPALRADSLPTEPSGKLQEEGHMNDEPKSQGCHQGLTSAVQPECDTKPRICSQKVSSEGGLVACALLAAHVPCQARKPGKDRRGRGWEAWEGRSRSTHSPGTMAVLRG